MAPSFPALLLVMLVTMFATSGRCAQPASTLVPVETGLPFHLTALDDPDCSPGQYTVSTSPYAVYFQGRKNSDARPNTASALQCQQYCDMECLCSWYAYVPEDNAISPRVCYLVQGGYPVPFDGIQRQLSYQSTIVALRDVQPNGAIAGDPRIVGGNGRVFHFNGQPDTSFCLISDRHLQVNSYFIGRQPTPGIPKLMTWVGSLSILTGEHSLEVKVIPSPVWNSAIDHLVIAYNGREVPFRKGQVLSTKSGVKIVRTRTNEAEIFIRSVLTLAVRAASVKKEWWTPDSSFIHLDSNFKMLKLTTLAHGILGQTYRPTALSISPKGPAIVGRMKDYITSNQWATDCKFNKYQRNPRLATVRRLMGHSPEKIITVQGMIMDDNEDEDGEPYYIGVEGETNNL